MKPVHGAVVAALGALALIGCGVRLTHFNGPATRRAAVQLVVEHEQPSRRLEPETQQPAAARQPVVAPKPRVPVTSAPPPPAALSPRAGGDIKGGGKAGGDGLSADACLIAKWGGVWALEGPRRMRYHVDIPTPGCDQRSAEVEGDSLATFPKAHGGGPGYALGAKGSKAACLRRACAGPGLRKPALVEAPTPLQAPPNGWGLGPAPGWIEGSPLRFNSVAIKAFAAGGSYEGMPPGQPLLLVFGGASVNDMLRNWALHVQKLALPYIVTCMDESLFTLAGKHGMPAAIFRGGSGEEASAGPGVVTTRWKYFRMDPRAFMTMGILKVRFFLAFLRAGFDILCADLDVLWLRDPRPWVTGQVATSALISFADIVVSTDVTSDAAENDRASWGLAQELNTGMLLLRSSPGAAVVCEAWVDRMKQEMVSIEKLPKNMLQWWSNDQTFFNEVHMRATLDGFANPKATDAARRERAAEHLRSIDRRPARMVALDAALKRLDDLIAAGPAKAGELEDVRGLQFRSRIGCDGQHHSFAIGTFPYELFASGHTFFSQSLQLRRGFSPVAVHTTFQFCDTAEFAWGKRSRLRERLLWLVDPDSYYERVGPASEPQPEPTELEYSGFLHLDGALLDMSSWPRPYMRSEASAAIKVEGSRSFVDATLARKSDVHTMRDGPARHLLLDSFQRRLIHDALALARAMKRKLILPPLQCWSDRYWNALVRGRFPGVRADAQPLPFHCPFDHLFDNEKWAHSDAPIREHSFLDSHRVPDPNPNPDPDPNPRSTPFSTTTACRTATGTTRSGSWCAARRPRRETTWGGSQPWRRAPSSSLPVTTTQRRPRRSSKRGGVARTWSRLALARSSCCASRSARRRRTLHSTRWCIASLASASRSATATTRTTGSGPATRVTRSTAPGAFTGRRRFPKAAAASLALERRHRQLAGRTPRRSSPRGLPSQRGAGRGEEGKVGQRRTDQATSTTST